MLENRIDPSVAIDIRALAAGGIPQPIDKSHSGLVSKITMGAPKMETPIALLACCYLADTKCLVICGHPAASQFSPGMFCRFLQYILQPR